MKDMLRSRTLRLLNINPLSIMMKYWLLAVPIGWMRWCAMDIRNSTIFLWMVVRRKLVIWLLSTIWTKKELSRIMVSVVFLPVWIWIKNWVNMFLSDWLLLTRRISMTMFLWETMPMNIPAYWPVLSNPILQFLSMTLISLIRNVPSLRIRCLCWILRIIR